MVAAHPAFVHQPGKAAGAGQDGEQRQFRQGDSAGAVVNEDDVVAGEGQLVAAAGRRPVDRADVALA